MSKHGRKRMLSVFGLALLLIGGNQYASWAAESDQESVNDGRRVFLVRCHMCHLTEEDQRPMNGPNLSGVFGARAGSKAAFKYSDAIKSSAIIWTEQNLDMWLTNPQGLIPKTKMHFGGIAKESERQALINYLKKGNAGH
jgi:cytochrome c